MDWVRVEVRITARRSGEAQVRVAVRRSGEGWVGIAVRVGL